MTETRRYLIKCVRWLMIYLTLFVMVSNAKALEIIRPGGILFTFSCSQAVSRENFRKSVFVAAANTGRRVRILQQLGHPADHPVCIYHPEGEYLKGLVLQIE